MPKLFGVDIAAEVNKGLGPGLLSAQLRKVLPGTRSTNKPTAGLSQSVKRYPCKGMISDYANSKIDGTRVQANDREVLLLGASIAGNKVPEADDEITIEGKTYTIIRVARDPAAATYTCQVRA